MKKKEKAFTLVELLGVIVLISALILLVMPALVGQVRKNEGKITDATKELIYSAAELYLDKHQGEYPRKNGNSYCVTLEQLVKSKDLLSDLKDAQGKEIDLKNRIVVTVKNGIYHYQYDPKNTCDT